MGVFTLTLALFDYQLGTGVISDMKNLLLKSSCEKITLLWKLIILQHTKFN